MKLKTEPALGKKKKYFFWWCFSCLDALRLSLLYVMNQDCRFRSLRALSWLYHSTFMAGIDHFWKTDKWYGSIMPGVKKRRLFQNEKGRINETKPCLCHLISQHGVKSSQMRRKRETAGEKQDWKCLRRCFVWLWRENGGLRSMTPFESVHYFVGQWLSLSEPTLWFPLQEETGDNNRISCSDTCDSAILEALKIWIYITVVLHYRSFLRFEETALKNI